ncbi:MAG: hypothetical protein KKF41_06490 [Actinobacteria bacterium]|nr:hypothetical protein [Actinomycetota bacterium]MBU1942541.1 hypothetical protein [Actinomycetota bacterium]MBU2687214.1 hypothetical protein [Actinomycetota bacterium]
MREINIPSLGGSVHRVPGAVHLLPTSGATWDGWFAIGIFPAGSTLRWAKAHFFRKGGPAGWHPLSAVECLVESEVMLSWATDDGVETFTGKVDPGPLESSTDSVRVSLPGRFALAGSRPRYGMSFSLPESGSGASFDFQASWPIWWARYGRLLSYVGQHSTLRLTLWRGETEETHAGFGVIEHVSGTSLPFDFTRRLPFGYHWDVLAFHTPGGRAESAAGLSISLKGEPFLGLKAAARLPGRNEVPMRGLSLRYLEFAQGTRPDGREFLVPASWEGVMRDSRGEFRYVARAATPVAPVLPGGGFLGFEFEGAYHHPYRSSALWSGTGFTEYADFSGELAR